MAQIYRHHSRVNRPAVCIAGGRLTAQLQHHPTTTVFVGMSSGDHTFNLVMTVEEAHQLVVDLAKCGIRLPK